jgi:hypothetical protein
MRIEDFLLSAATRVFFALYWIFDNLNILSRLGLLKVNAKTMGERGAACWFVALLATLVLTLKNIILRVYQLLQMQK